MGCNHTIQIQLPCYSEGAEQQRGREPSEGAVFVHRQPYPCLLFAEQRVADFPAVIIRQEQTIHSELTWSKFARRSLHK